MNLFNEIGECFNLNNNAIKNEGLVYFIIRRSYIGDCQLLVNSDNPFICLEIIIIIEIKRLYRIKEVLYFYAIGLHILFEI